MSGEASDVMSNERQAVEEAHRRLWEMLGGHIGPNSPRFEDVYQLAADEITSLRARLVEGRRGGPSQAALDVLAERQRQTEVEGWTPEHDDTHVSGALAAAALCYVQAALCREGKPASEPPSRPGFWPWEWSWWKPKNTRRDLVRAAALIVAEIERLDRATERA